MMQQSVIEHDEADGDCPVPLGTEERESHALFCVSVRRILFTADL